MDMTEAVRPPSASGQQYPTVEQARDQNTLKRQEEILARRFLQEHMIVMGPDDTRSVVQVARKKGFLPSVSIVEDVETAEKHS